MALTYQLGDIPDWKDLDSGEIQVVVFMTMFVGIPEITDKNWQDFYKRARAWERVHGTISSNNEPMSQDLVKKFIGLYTNASRMTVTQFKNRLFEGLMK